MYCIWIELAAFSRLDYCTASYSLFPSACFSFYCANSVHHDTTRTHSFIWSTQYLLVFLFSRTFHTPARLRLVRIFLHLSL